MEQNNFTRAGPKVKRIGHSTATRYIATRRTYNDGSLPDNVAMMPETLLGVYPTVEQAEAEIERVFQEDNAEQTEAEYSIYESGVVYHY